MSGRLPQPIGRQKEVLCLPAQGHHVVLGTAGSGKTTMAVHRAIYLANPNTDHHGRTLLVTFNRCLVAYLRSLSRDFPREVTVENYHKFARGYLNSRGRMRRNSICGPDQQILLCQRAVVALREAGETNPVLERPAEFLVEEFRWLAQHGVTTVADYVTSERIGRTGARILRADRPVVFRANMQYRQLRTAAGKDYDWEDVASTVYEEFTADESDRYYRHVVIDEGQDFSPMMLRSLAVAVPPDGSLTFFGDMAQQIYGNKMSWRSAGLTVRQVWEFEENYRNTKQVSKLALAIAALPYFRDVIDLVEPKAPVADGPQPALVSFRNEGDELNFVVVRAKRLAQTGTVAVLFRNREQEDAIEPLIPNATRLHRELAIWPSGSGLFYGTYHAAKGLEFDAVFLPHVSVARLPHPPDVIAFGSEDAAIRDSRLLYVAVTRAKSTLVLTHIGQLTYLLPADEDLYQRSSR
jgi:superfamily I DNA/RNA helicase